MLYIRKKKMRTPLSTIQILHRTGRILSRLAFAVSVIAVVSCTAAVICLTLGVEETASFLASLSVFDGNTGCMYHILISAAVTALGEAVVAKQAVSYFKAELNAGTPFNGGNALRLRKLGIITIVIPLVTAVISDVLYEILIRKFDYFDSGISYATGGSIAIGVMFIILSVLCRYGAELDGEEKQN